MILAIDTSSARSALALLEPSGAVIREDLRASGPGLDLPALYREMAGDQRLSRVAVAIGPGSFTGLRVGVSFGLGLAMGLRIPIVPLSTLRVQVARGDGHVVGVAEAGRGRVYFLAPGGEAGLGEPEQVPLGRPLAGWLGPATEAALAAAGHRMEPEGDLRTFGAAVAQALESASEVAYGSLKLEYMQSAFSARTPGNSGHRAS